jgi:hypothetical protein
MHLLTYLLTYSLTPWSRVLFEKVTGLQLECVCGNSSDATFPSSTADIISCVEELNLRSVLHTTKMCSLKSVTGLSRNSPTEARALSLFEHVAFFCTVC